MNITCITVCVDYHDYLEKTFYWNLGHFDKHVVITTPQDALTKQICADYGVEHLSTSSFYFNGDKFNKGRALNKGLGAIAPADWVLFMDADIILPLDFGEKLRKLELNPEHLYYSRRGTIPKATTNAELEKLKLDPARRSVYKILSWSDDALPWGFFQLVSVHSPQVAGKGWRWFPVHHPNANEYDTEFKNQWPPDKQELLPQEDFRVLHLWHGPRGENWKGRAKEE